MTKKENDILKKLGITWINGEGFLNLEKFPIDGILKQAVGENEEGFSGFKKLNNQIR